MKNPVFPQDQVYWYLEDDIFPSLNKDIAVDVAIVGGGMAGLSAAQAFLKKGLKVAVLEKNYCGAGATGKSSGFVTPNSELSLQDLQRLHGLDAARELWQLVLGGVEHIRNTIKEYDIVCGYNEEETLVVATSTKKFNDELLAEEQIRQRLGYKSSLYGSKEEVSQILGSSYYEGGIAYGDSFTINAYHYCQSLKKKLSNAGVLIFEETPVTELQENMAIAPQGSVRAQYIILCTDRFTLNFQKLVNALYHVQTFLLFSQRLTDEQIHTIFPKQRYMVWDTALIYNYFRLTEDNRLMVGGSNLLYTYSSKESHNNSYVQNIFNSYIARLFPEMNIYFEYMWPGIIGISKDILPIAGFDTELKSLYHITAATGLPWAAALGLYCAENVLDHNNHFEKYLSPQRSFALGNVTQKILGVPFTFALSHFMTVSSL